MKQMDATTTWDNPIANILRNPTSILPKDWQLEGRKYLDESSTPPSPTPVPQTPPLEPAPPVSAPVAPVPAAPPTDLPVPLDGMTQEEKIRRIREQIESLQGTLKSDAFSISSGPPMGVPPAAATEPEALLLHAPPPTVLDQMPLADSYTSALDTSSFAFVADGGLADVGSGLLATTVFAALGALAFEYIATNKQAPIPDPLLSGLWSSLHAAIRAASKATGSAAKIAIATLPIGGKE